MDKLRLVFMALGVFIGTLLGNIVYQSLIQPKIVMQTSTVYIIQEPEFKQIIHVNNCLTGVSNDVNCTVCKINNTFFIAYATCYFKLDCETGIDSLMNKLLKEIYKDKRYVIHELCNVLLNEKELKWNYNCTLIIQLLKSNYNKILGFFNG